MKKTILMVIMSLMFIGTVNASSYNGDYKGNPIVKIYSDGSEVKPDDVPALIYNGRTVVPISMLKKLGVNVAWNSTNYSVVVEIPDAPIERNLDVSQIAKNMKKFNVDFVGYTSDGDGFIRTTYYYSKKYNDISYDDFNAILTSSASTDSYLTEIYGDDGVIFNVVTQAIRDFKSGKITEEELRSKYEFQGIEQTTSTSSSAVSNATSSPTSAMIPVATATPKPDNTEQCRSLRSQYAAALANLPNTVTPFGGKSYEEKMLDYTWTQALNDAGC